jgi:hypothetical protein
MVIIAAEISSVCSLLQRPDVFSLARYLRAAPVCEHASLSVLIAARRE